MAHKRQLCVRHGGGRKCKVDACMTHARSWGYCCRHSHAREDETRNCGKADDDEVPDLMGVLMDFVNAVDMTSLHWTLMDDQRLACDASGEVSTASPANDTNTAKVFGDIKDISF
ncbi:Aste57867_2224 [Aphanomyces stellatus]|nr:hypothetical protein As57867_002219 [Aphanomyces stellatus]VFT79427.1 Aste57867_2224 [Aphanomyces stellatus]